MYDDNKRWNEIIVCHRLWSIFRSIVQICSLTREHQVFQYVPCTSIPEQFEGILLTILPRISILPFWSDGRQGMELILCSVVESSCSPTHNIFLHISWHDLPYHKTTKKNENSQSMEVYQFPPRKFRDSNLVLRLSTISLLISHCLWVQPKYTWSRKDVGSPKSTSLLSTFHIGLRMRNRVCAVFRHASRTWFEINGHPCMVLRLWIIVESFCSQVRKIFTYISLCDLPRHGTKKILFLHQVSLKLR